MSWPITLHEKRPESPQVGDMWPAPWLNREGVPSRWVSREYLAQRAAIRPPLVVRLPGAIDFCIDAPAGGGDSGWGVTGDGAKVTLSPSINHPGTYHGWIQNGVITDDCEGRKFPADPPTPL